MFNIRNQKERKLTRDGSETILNGIRGWLYEEEFGSFDGYRWSPDSKHILFFLEDQSMVRKFTFLDETKLYPEIKQVYYPKTGEKNPTVKIGVVTIRGGRTKWLETGKNENMYFPKADWFENQPVVARLNRKQNHLEWLKYDKQRPDYEEYVASLRYMERVDDQIIDKLEGDPDAQVILDGSGNIVDLNN